MEGVRGSEVMRHEQGGLPVLELFLLNISRPGWPCSGIALEDPL